MELAKAEGEDSYTIWISDINHKGMIYSSDFIGLQSDSVEKALDDVYIWIKGFDYHFDQSEIIVYNLQDFLQKTGKLRDDSFWDRAFGDFVSYFAGATGMTCQDACGSLIIHLPTQVNFERYKRMGDIILQLRRQSNSSRNLLAKLSDMAEQAKFTNLVLKGFEKNDWYTGQIDLIKERSE